MHVKAMPGRKDIIKDHREGAVAVISLRRLRRQYLQKAHHSECERLFIHGKQLTFMTCQLSYQTVPKLSPCIAPRNCTLQALSQP